MTLQSNPLWAPLEGHNLIEASAGTGKTFTIAGLYLRLVLEQEWPVDQILVITFTEAATQELRDRIRRGLEEAWQGLQTGSSTNPFLKDLVHQLQDKPRSQLLLRRALHDFDQAAIYTIHGFCQRALADHAFESRRPFAMELLADTSELVQEVVDDFWRCRAAQLPALFLDYLQQKALGPESLRNTIAPYLGKPRWDLHIRAVSSGPAMDTTAYITAYQHARQLWLSEQNAIRQRLMAGLSGYKKNQYSEQKLEKWLELMDAHLAAEQPPVSWFDDADKLTASKLQRGTRKQAQPPQHPFFTAMDDVLSAWTSLETAFAARTWNLVHEALDYAWQELPRRKAQRRVQGFDDLLLSLDQALQEDAGAQLAARLRQRFPVALIDEFQDTDPVQYRIIATLYTPLPGPLFLVGDPKQAIYGFRGADIFAYLRARSHIAHQDNGTCYNLPHNWRSCPGLVTAFNSLFATKQPFWFSEIEYNTVQAASAKTQLELQGFDPAPCQWRFLPPTSAEESPKNKSQATQEAVNATAEEIASLLTAACAGKAHISDPQQGFRALSGQDIAVLVRTHNQARQVRHALSRRGIASVEHSQQSVFASQEARELQRVLLAIQQPRRDDLLRAALATRLYGYTAAQIYQLTADDDAWEKTTEPFQHLHQYWHSHGFMSLFRHWLTTAGIRCRLLTQPEGERRLTNLLHLGELLHEQAQQGNLGMEELLTWLEQRCQAPSQNREEEQLRLESEANLVQLVTIHKSKGLEYPVVFCPFLWDLTISAARKEAVAFHDPDNDNNLTLDLGSDRHQQGLLRHQEEELAENLRLLYVAVTRAIHRLYLITGSIFGLEKSALGYLVHADKPDTDHWQAVTQTVPKDNPDVLWQHLQAYVTAQPQVFALSYVSSGRPEQTGTPPMSAATSPLQERPFHTSLDRHPVITSFSGLVEGMPQDLPGAEPLAENTPQQESAGESMLDDAAAFPKGMEAGICLHAILEAVDFNASPTQWQEAIQRLLQEHGFRAQTWETTVCQWLTNVVTTPLGGSLGAQGLQQLPPASRCHEMEFYFPLSRFSYQDLAKLLKSYQYHAASLTPEGGAALAFRPQEGFMHGFIDLVFTYEGRYYVADYKSNWLGPNAAAYTRDKLTEAINSHGYALQYLIYSVALHRQLQLRLPDYHYDTHFGGVYYLFLRGMNPHQGPGAGVYHDRPAYQLIQQLDELFRGT